MRNLLQRLRKDTHGGPVLVLAFSVIAVTVVMGLGAISMANGAVTHTQRVTQAAEASVRRTVDTILADINQGRRDPQEILDDLVGQRFTLDQDRAAVGGGTEMRGATTIESATFDGQEVKLELTVESEGRSHWSRHGSASLVLAKAVSLSRIEDGRAVWDFAAPVGANSEVDETVALWTAGELSIFVEGLEQEKPTAPNPVTLTSDLVDGKGVFTAEYAGGCFTGEDPKIQMRASVNGAAFGQWQDTLVRQGAIATGQKIAVEARVRCEGGSRTSNWAMKSASIKRSSTAVPAQPAMSVTVEDGGFKVKVDHSDLQDAIDAGAVVRQQMRYRFDGEREFSQWVTLAGNDAEVMISATGQTLHLENRIRILWADGSDTGWSAPRSNDYQVQ